MSDKLTLENMSEFEGEIKTTPTKGIGDHVLEIFKELEKLRSENALFRAALGEIGELALRYSHVLSTKQHTRDKKFYSIVDKVFKDVEAIKKMDEVEE